MNINNTEGNEKYIVNAYEADANRYSIKCQFLTMILISSIVMLKKQKIKADAYVKITIFSILSILSWVLFQSAWIILLLIIPAALGITVLLKPLPKV